MPRSELHGVLDAAVDAILIIDYRGVITTFNRSAERIFGYAADEVIGRNVSMLMPEPYRSSHDDYLARYARTGIAHIIGIGREVEAQRKDGSRFPVALSVGRIDGSDPARYVGFVRDVTPQHEAMATIRRERDRANGYLELFPSVLLTLDAEGRIASINEHGAAILETSEGELVGRRFVDAVIGQDDRSRIEAAVRLLRLGGDGHERAEFIARTPGSPPRTVEWRCLRVDPFRVLCAGEDITEDLRREEEARHSQERLMNVARLATMGELAAVVAHELNQPLAAIANYARAAQRFLARPAPDTGEAGQALDEVAAEALRAGEIIHRLRRLIGGQAHARRLTDVNELIEDLQDLLRADARAHHTQVQFDLTRPLPMVMIDPAELQHVLLNLARNAVEALSSQPPATRQMRISTRRTPQGPIEILVSDNGPGVREDMVQRMFEPFATSKPGGTGLGLAIGRSILKSNGGRLDYSSAEPQGACFRVYLPANEEQAA